MVQPGRSIAVVIFSNGSQSDWEVLFDDYRSIVDVSKS